MYIVPRMTLPKDLPSPARLKSLMQSLAALDAIYSPEWEYRYYSFASKWGKGENMGSIRNGSGDTVFVLFNHYGALLKVFAHEYQSSDITPEGFYQGVPEDLSAGVKEPAFSPHNVTYCSWRANNDPNWICAVSEMNFEEDSFFLLQGLDGQTKTYHEFTANYYEIEANIEHIAAIYEHRPMTEKLARAMNAKIDYPKLVLDLNEINYPVDIQPANSKGFLKRLLGR